MREVMVVLLRLSCQLRHFYNNGTLNKSWINHHFVVHFFNAPIKKGVGIWLSASSPVCGRLLYQLFDEDET